MGVIREYSDAGPTSVFGRIRGERSDDPMRIPLGSCENTLRIIGGST